MVRSLLLLAVAACGASGTARAPAPEAESVPRAPAPPADSPEATLETWELRPTAHLWTPLPPLPASREVSLDGCTTLVLSVAAGSVRVSVLQAPSNATQLATGQALRVTGRGKLSLTTTSRPTVVARLTRVPSCDAGEAPLELRRAEP